MKQTHLIQMKAVSKMITALIAMMTIIIKVYLTIDRKDRIQVTAKISQEIIMISL